MHAVRMAWKEEPSFRFQIVITILSSLLAAYLKISHIEWAILILALATVLTTELINTAIERVGNTFARPNDPLIGLIKDLGAAAAGVIGIGAIITLAIIFVPRLIQFL